MKLDAWPGESIREEEEEEKDEEEVLDKSFGATWL